MRLNINLASQKYEDVRRFYVQWGSAIGVAALLTLVLLFLAWRNYHNTIESNARIQNLEQQITELERQRAEAKVISDRPENHDITAQKNYWNRQIARRAFSWTQLFNDLQRIMPARAYVSSVHPEITPDNRLKLSLQIMGDTHTNGLELVQKMEKSERFRGPTIKAEATQKDRSGSATLYRFDIDTYYSPGAIVQQQRPANREGY
jgi:Tfp pilus assembly protein PilN